MARDGVTPPDSALAALSRDGSVRVEDRTEANRIADAWLAANAAKQHTAEKLAADREWLLEQKPGEANERAAGELKRRGIDFETAYAAFNRRDYNEVERFLRVLGAPAGRTRTRHGSHPAQRPRERRATSRARARAPDDSDPEPPEQIAALLAGRWSV